MSIKGLPPPAPDVRLIPSSPDVDSAPARDARLKTPQRTSHGPAAPRKAHPARRALLDERGVLADVLHQVGGGHVNMKLHHAKPRIAAAVSVTMRLFELHEHASATSSLSPGVPRK